MGKHNKKRFNRGRRARYDPLNATNGDAPMAEDANGTTSGSGSQIFPIVQKLASAKPEDRSWSASAISNLVLEDSIRSELLGSQVVVALMNAIKSETNLAVTMELIGALRNLVSFSSEEVALECISNGVLDALQPYIQHAREVISELASGQKPSSEEEAEKRQQKLIISEQIFVVLWTLAEASFDTVTAISTNDFVGLVMNFLQASEFVPASTLLSAAQLLNVLSDGNNQLGSAFQADENATNFLKVVSEGGLPNFSGWEETRSMARILLAGTLFNVFGADPQYLPSILKAIMFVLDFNFDEMLAQAETVLSTVTDLTESKRADDLVENTSTHVGTVQFALELLTNIFSEETVEETGGWDESAEEGDDDMEMTEEEYLSSMRDGEMEDLDSPSIEVLKQGLSTLEESNSLSRILKIASISIQPLRPLPTASKIINSISIVRVRAFSSLSNIFGIASRTAFFELNVVGIGNVWNEIFAISQVALTEAPENSEEGSKEEITEAILSTLWSLARGADAVRNGGIGTLPITSIQVTSLIAFASPNLSPTPRIMCVGLLGILGKAQGHIDGNRAIGDFFMSLLETEDSVEVLSEVLNGIFDIYADKAFDYDQPVFASQNYLSRLKAVFERIRSKARAVEKRKNKAVRERADEAVMNLRAFIKYKESEK
ncbi:hypothetical protein HDU97_006153 [Phlyctochytrium planicorne]|nr:hypothetical protein HDU97_006153 [Phlyctochytrium planicorne]